MLSNEQKEARKGLFTSSGIHNLMGVKCLGDTGLTYIEKVAYEFVFGINEDEQLDTFDIRRGNELEPFAFKKFQSLDKNIFINVEKGGFKKVGSSGSTPDGFVGENDLLEIKCPREEKFFKLVRKGIEAIDKQYLWQMQHQMFVHDKQSVHFFNYIIRNNIELHHTIIVRRNDEEIAKMQSRISEATLILKDFINEFELNKQF